MKRQALQQVLKKLDSLGIYTFTHQDLRLHFPDEAESTFKSALRRHVKDGILENPCRGIYLNPNAASWDSYPLEHISKTLRRGEYSYISLESLLSETGIISQVPINLLTVMTTGRSQKYKTPYGTVEFTHTQRDIPDILSNTYKDSERPLRVASETMAVQDLKNVKRNTHLIDYSELKQ